MATEDENEQVNGVTVDVEVPPVRRGTRDDRREATLRQFTAGEEAGCAYCGRPLPPLPPRGGRPTPYCPADPHRYGQWGAKVISCAMLDENREIWINTYGPDHPMTQVDVASLDARATALLAAIEPMRDEITAFQTRVDAETTAALTAKADAELVRDQALEQARSAHVERDKARSEARAALQQSEHDRAELRLAQDLAAKAVHDREQAIAQRRAAEKEKDKAEADRQRALEQVGTSQERITELQNTLAEERAAALERLDQLRQQETRARETLRAALTDELEQRLRARAGELDELRANADQRVADLTSRLTQASQVYAETLGPLHEQLGQLRHDVIGQTTLAAALQQRLTALQAALRDIVQQPVEDGLMRDRIAAIIERSLSSTLSDEP